MDIGRRQNADPRWLLPLICRRGAHHQERGRRDPHPGRTRPASRSRAPIAARFAAAVIKSAGQDGEDDSGIRIQPADGPGSAPAAPARAQLHRAAPTGNDRVRPPRAARARRRDGIQPTSRTARAVPAASPARARRGGRSPEFRRPARRRSGGQAGLLRGSPSLCPISASRQAEKWTPKHVQGRRVNWGADEPMSTNPPHPGRCRRLSGQGRDLQGRVAAGGAGHDRQQLADPRARASADRPRRGERRVRRRRRLDRRTRRAGRGGRHRRHPARRPLPEGGRGGAVADRQAVHHQLDRRAIATRAIMADLRAGGDQLGGPSAPSRRPTARAFSRRSTRCW